MNSLVKWYLWLEKFVPGLLFFSIFIAMLLEIFSRALAGTSFSWSTEYCRYALVWVTFIGAVYVRREGTHIQVLFLHQWLEERARREGGVFHVLLWTVNFIRLAVALAFWFFLFYYGYRLAARTTRFYSSAMAVSQYWLYFCTVVCGLLAGIMELGNFARLLRGTYVEPVAAGNEEGV